MFGELPKLFKDEEELRTIWSKPATRKALLEQLEEAGFPKTDLITLQQLVDMEKATSTTCSNTYSTVSTSPSPA